MTTVFNKKLRQVTIQLHPADVQVLEWLAEEFLGKSDQEAVEQMAGKVYTSGVEACSDLLASLSETSDDDSEGSGD